LRTKEPSTVEAQFARSAFELVGAVVFEQFIPDCDNKPPWPSSKRLLKNPSRSLRSEVNGPRRRIAAVPLGIGAVIDVVMSISFVEPRNWLKTIRTSFSILPSMAFPTPTNIEIKY
jgi:hypothetical protein